MGRVEKRRQDKLNKNRNKNYKEEKTEYTGREVLFTTLKIVFAFVILVFVLYYVVAVFITGELDITSSSDTTEEESSASVSNKILAKNIFNQAEEEYYVYFYDFNDEDDDLASAISYITDYVVYRVDTSSALNSNYISLEDGGNTSATTLSDLSVVSPTLLKITNDSIDEYYEGVDDILEYLDY